MGFPEQGRCGFIGRDYDILRLERAFRQNNIVLLQGMGGVGKTELTVGFARWLEETQGREKIFFTSFNIIWREIAGEKCAGEIREAIGQRGILYK